MSSEDLDQGSTIQVDAVEDVENAPGGILQTIRDLSVRSKFLIMMLLTSLLSMGIVSLISYKVGRDALVREVFNQLTSLSASKKQQVEDYFGNMHNTVAVLGENTLVSQALLSFASSVQAVDSTPASAAQVQRLHNYYENEFIPRVVGESVRGRFVDEYLPKSSRARSLQAFMMSENPFPVGKKGNLLVPEETTAYSLTHEAHHKWFRKLAEKHEFYDVFLIDQKSDRIVYSVAKEVDFATSLTDGPHSQSNLARLYKKIKNAPQRGEVSIVDYDRYLPSYNDPAGFIATPVFSGRRFIGVLAAQYSIDAINDFMNVNGKWRDVGLGESGETYVVGRDSLMRSNSRFLIEDPEKLKRDLVRAGASKLLIDNVLAKKATVLTMPVKTPATAHALSGLSGTKIIDDYRGISVLSSYTPVDVKGLDWVLIAEMDEDEAMKPQRDFQRLLMLAAAGLTLLTTLGSMLLSRLFLGPVNAMVEGIEKLRQGQTDVKITKVSGDEFGELTDAFNAMSSEIRRRDKTIEGKSEAYETLLKRIFPETVAEKLKQGQGQTADSFPQVSVIYVILSGLEELATQSDGQTSFELLNQIVEMFDAEAERLGIEKVKTIGEHYLATCGLTVPRLDHARLAMKFVESISAGIERHNRSHDTKLTIRAGLHVGLVHAGIVGNRQFVYDIWGPSVNVARRIVYEADLGSVRITEDAIAQLGDEAGFTDSAVVHTRTMGEIRTRQKSFDLGISHDELFDVSVRAPRAAE